MNEKYISTDTLFERDFEEYFKKGCLLPEITRRGLMKSCFYNTKDDIMDTNYSDLPSLIGKEYVLHKRVHDLGVYRIVFAECNQLHKINALTLVKVDVINKYGSYESFLDRFKSYRDMKEKHWYNGNTDIVYLVSTWSVQEALSALFKENKHMVYGYHNKTVTLTRIPK